MAVVSVGSSELLSQYKSTRKDLYLCNTRICICTALCT